MVRLKGAMRAPLRNLYVSFQFHYGTIKSRVVSV